MKLPENDISVETSGVQEEHLFGIGDLGVIFDVLRNKMYSDPIGAICREISCNARDSHRVAGKRDVPIKIILPSNLDPHVRFIDFGTGISPDRVVNIFINYGSSDKRNTNDLVGGFGLGGKTPFAFSDSFSIITCVDGVKYSYSAYIDETKIGKLVLLSKVPTDETNGTEIKIPVPKANFGDFAVKLEAATRWWEVQPEVVNGVESKRTKTEELVLKGQNWEIYKNRNYYSDRFAIIIDGIHYPLAENVGSDFRNKRGFNLLFNGAKQCVLYFNNGDLTLAANREQVQWDDRSIKAVEARMLEMIGEIKLHLTTAIDKCSTYIEAVICARELNLVFESATNNHVWQGQQVKASITASNSYTDPWFFYRTRRIPGTPVVSKDIDRKKHSYVDLTDDLLLIVNDTPLANLTVIRAAQVFNALPDGNKNFTLIPKKEWDERFQDLQAHVPNKLLSSLIVTKSASTKIRKPRKTLFLFDSYNFGRSSYENFEACTKVKVYTFVTKDGMNKVRACNSKGSIVDSSMFEPLMREHNLAIYAFDWKLFQDSPDDFSDYTDDAVELMEYVKENVLIKYDIEALFQCRQSDPSNRGLILSRLITNQLGEDTVFGKLLEAHDKVSKNRKAYRSFGPLLEEIYPEFKLIDGEMGDHELEKIMSEIESKYPLIALFMKSSHYSYECESNINHYIQYINLIDRSIVNV